MKTCRKCCEQKDIEQFGPDKRAKDGKRGVCRKCCSVIQVEWARTHREKRKVYQQRWNDKNKERVKEVGRVYAAKWREKYPDKYRAAHTRKRFKRYGVDAEWYAAQLAKQNGVCLICGKSCSSGRPLGVDHDHATGQVRGLLCGRCNSSLARFEEIDGWGHKAIAYLREYGVEI